MKAKLVPMLTSLILLAAATPAEARGRYRTPPSAHVLVYNDTAAAMTVQVDGAAAKVLRPYETQDFHTYAGTVSVEATYEQFGIRYKAYDRELRVRPHATAYAEIDTPTVGHVKLVNDSGAPATAYASGREIAELLPGTSRVVALPLGRTEIVMWANGTMVESSALTVRPLQDVMVVAEAPRFADVVVESPFAFPVLLDTGRGKPQTVAAFGRVTLREFAVGTHAFTVRHLSGQPIDGERLTVRPWTGAFYTIDVPDQGLVRLTSRDRETLRVFEAGQLVALINPRSDAAILLPAGYTTLEVRDIGGRLVSRETLRVDPLREMELGLGRDDRRRDDGQHRPPGAVSDHDHDHDSGGQCRGSHGRDDG